MINLTEDKSSEWWGLVMKNVSQWFIRSSPTSKMNEMTEVALSPTGSIRCISNTCSHWRRIWPNYNPTNLFTSVTSPGCNKFAPQKNSTFFLQNFSQWSLLPPQSTKKKHIHRFRRICCSPIITYSWLDNPPRLYIKYRCTSSRGNAGYPATDSWWILRILPATLFTKA